MARTEGPGHRSGERQIDGGPRVLVVDDDPTMRLIFGRTLALAGYDVTEAVDGLEAVEIFERNEGEFDAVLLDLVMPRLDGFKTYRRLRRKKPGIPVLVVSGVAAEEAMAQLGDRSYLAFLKKPIIPRFLVHQLAELLASRPRIC